jgi:hypothetical protein
VTRQVTVEVGGHDPWPETPATRPRRRPASSRQGRSARPNNMARRSFRSSDIDVPVPRRKDAL